MLVRYDEASDWLFSGSILAATLGPSALLSAQARARGSGLRLRQGRGTLSIFLCCRESIARPLAPGACDKAILAFDGSRSGDTLAVLRGMVDSERGVTPASPLSKAAAQGALFSPTTVVAQDFEKISLEDVVSKVIFRSLLPRSKRSLQAHHGLSDRLAGCTGVTRCCLCVSLRIRTPNRLLQPGRGGYCISSPGVGGGHTV